MSHPLSAAESPAAGFTRALSEAARVLALGQALSRSSTAFLAQRHEDGFLLGEIVGTQGRISETAQRDGPGRNHDPAGTRLHAAVFEARPAANAGVLIRAPRLAAWGLSRRALPVRYFQMFSYTRATEIPVVPAVPEAVGLALSDQPDTPALLLEDGRALIWAPEAARAVRLVLSLEEAAHVTQLADWLGGAKDYPLEAREKIYQSLQAQKRS